MMQLGPPTSEALAIFSLRAIQYAVLVLGYLFLLATSGRVVTWVLSTIEEPPVASEGDAVAGEDSPIRDAEGDGPTDGVAPSPTQTERDVGRIIGKCENVLVVTFVLAGAFTALALVFGAKSIVRREDMQNNSKYYLAGTLVNFTYSLLVGGVLRLVV